MPVHLTEFWLRGSYFRRSEDLHVLDVFDQGFLRKMLGTRYVPLGTR